MNIHMQNTNNCMMKKKCFLFMIFLFMLFFCGCASTYGLTEEQQIHAFEKYPPGGLNLEPSDSGFLITVKIVSRIIVFPLTFGISEIILVENRESSYLNYANFLYYNTFLGNPCATVIKAFGAPSRVTTDGQEGKIYVFEKVYTSGGTSYPVTTYYGNVPHTTYHSTPLRLHKHIKEFYFTKDDKCYHWRVVNE